MVTRRDLLAGLACLPCRIDLKALQTEPEIYSEPHSLSEESAGGYRRLLQGQRKFRVLVAAGLREVSLQQCLQWRERMNDGAWLIFESGVCFSTDYAARRQAELLKRTFGIRLHPPVHAAHSYVEYRLPERILVRTFEKFTPVDCQPREAIAFSSGRAVGMRKAVGSGGIVYLGSMLGPGLISREREADIVGRRLIASGGLDTLRSRASTQIESRVDRSGRHEWS